MHISTISILFVAELFLVLTGLCIFLIVYIRKLKNTSNETPESDIKDEITIDISNTYIDYLEQELLKNDELSFETPLPHDTDALNSASEDESEVSEDAAENIEHEQHEEIISTEVYDDSTGDETDIKSKLLDIRTKFLNVEKSAAENTEDEHIFWDKMFAGLQSISDEFTSTKETPSNEKTSELSDDEKVIYIQAQGKKINGEVNKLKDIIYDQEDTLNDLTNALKKAEAALADENQAENSEAFQDLKTHAHKLVNQINDSKMCMEIMELENQRLQSEVDNLQQQYNELFKSQKDGDKQSTIIADSSENIDQMKETLDKQEQQINELSGTIDELELSAQQAETLKETLSEFARNSKEMIGCIAILEDENEFLSKMTRDLEQQLETTRNSSAAGSQENPEASEISSEELESLNAKIKIHEKEIIKKDVAYAKLQDELSSLEKEYQSMYEAMQEQNQ